MVTSFSLNELHMVTLTAFRVKYTHVALQAVFLCIHSCCVGGMWAGREQVEHKDLWNIQVQLNVYTRPPLSHAKKCFVGRIKHRLPLDTNLATCKTPVTAVS